MIRGILRSLKRMSSTSFRHYVIYDFRKKEVCKPLLVTFPFHISCLTKVYRYTLGAVAFSMKFLEMLK